MTKKKQSTIVWSCILFIMTFVRGNVIGNTFYYILLAIEIIAVTMYFGKFFNTKLWCKDVAVLKVIGATLLITYLFLIPFNDTLVVMSSNRKEQILLDGEFIGVTRSGFSYKKYIVTFEFANGKIITWKVPLQSMYYDNGKMVLEYDILDNYTSYKKIQVIGYKSPLGIELAHFKVTGE